MSPKPIIDIAVAVYSLKNVERYSSLKKHLADKYESDRTSYTKAKNQFITKIIKKALDEERVI